MDQYGRDHDALSAYMNTLPAESICAENIDILCAEDSTEPPKVLRTMWTKASDAKSHLSVEVRVRTFRHTALTKSLLA